MLIKDIRDLKKKKSIWRVQESMQGFHFNQKLKTESITIFNVKILNMYFLLTLHVNTGSERRKKKKKTDFLMLKRPSHLHNLLSLNIVKLK